MIALSCQSLSKSYSARALFTTISFGINDDERLGLIGPNGAGKSTLLQILAGRETPDAGVVSARRGLRVGYVAQDETFAPNESVAGVLDAAMAGETWDETERATRKDVALARVGFASGDQAAAALSGGWKKRLAIARELIREPNLLLLDEPTNHLDLDGVLWLEDLLQNAGFAFVVVTHDRQFLENVAGRVMELNAVYEDGYLSSDGAYSDFLVKRQNYLQAQAHQEQALATQVTREIAWLRRGARARTTKAKGRIEDAEQMIGALADVKARNAQTANTVHLGFSASGRKTKELLVATGVNKSLGGRTLISGLDLTLSPGMKVGLVGRNGSGKTTLLKILTDQLAPDAGTVKRADRLRVVWFDQNREQLDPDQTLRDALCPNGDTVLYQNGAMHVSAWAKRFLFRPEQLAGTVGRLSGGEQARVLIARLMLQPADLLLLDEPTNDLDIPSLEVLENSLHDFAGAIVLVTHDRFLLDSVSTEVFVLEENGPPRRFADYSQWERTRAAAATINEENSAARPKSAAPPAPPLAGLTAAERRELREVENKIEAAETAVAALERQLEDPAVASDHARLQEVWDGLPPARDAVARLYARWEELEARQS